MVWNDLINKGELAKAILDKFGTGEIAGKIKKQV
jgi:hypothetical protein